MDERTRRIGLNEALFREVNDRVDEVNRTFSTPSGVVEVLCECGDADCRERLTIAHHEYEAVRSDGAQFVVAPGHDSPDVESVVHRASEFHVLRKQPGGPEELARALDPR